MKITSKKLAKYSLDAYSKSTISAGGTEMLIKNVGGFSIWALRGTEFDFGDILDDIRVMPWWSKETGGFVHKGFLSGVRAIWPHLPLAGFHDKPVILTGHSKGGAEAILLGAMLTTLDMPPSRIETFGAPRVGFSGLGEIIKDIPGERHRLGIDIVPTVPHSFPLPYRHDRDLTDHDPEQSHIFKNHRIADYIAAL